MKLNGLNVAVGGGYRTEEKLGGKKLWRIPLIRILADKKIGELCNVPACCKNVTLKVGEKNFGEFILIRQIHQSFYCQVFLPYSTC